MALKTCQFGNCLEDISGDGVMVSLKTPTFDDEKRAGYCCSYHAALSLLRLAIDRKEVTEEQAIEGARLLPRRWRST